MKESVNYYGFNSVKEYKQFILAHNFDVEQLLKHTLKKIAFLESIYESGGENNHYTRRLQDAAIDERNNLCFLSSACSLIIGKKKQDPAYITAEA